MTTSKCMLSNFPWNERYRITGLDDVLTPTLVIYPEAIAANISRTLQVLGGDADRWRVHIKTAKLSYTLRMLIESRVRNFKCATTLELLMACQEGAADVLVAYPMVGANARRVREIADQFRDIRISVLAENEDQMRHWRGSRVTIFLDINPGMNRTGVEQADVQKAIGLVRAVAGARLDFRGLHYYDGQYGALEEPERMKGAHSGYDQLLALVSEIEGAGFRVPEVVTAGTPTFPCSLAYEGFQRAGFIHRCSPGTVVYHDATSLAQLPPEWSYMPAVLVVTRVVSHPHEGIVTCDAGHKAVSADQGVPTCVVVGHPELTPLSPSEEHLPMHFAKPPEPNVGDALYLLPRHVCPTVNNFDCALMVRNGRIESTERVSARGHEEPLLHTLTAAPLLR